MRPALVFVLAFAVAACGGGREHGTATLWVTRDRGTQVLYTGTVPAGLSAMQALERVRKVSTRYGGRFVQSIDGVDGSLTKQRDWFYFVDGIEGDRSAAEVTLHPGDVEWWDYRTWAGGSMSVAVVVGAYPKPFAGTRPTVVADGVARSVAATIAKQVGGTVTAGSPIGNSIVVSARFAPGLVQIRRVRAHFRLELGVAAARRLAADENAFRYRYGAAG